MKTKIEKAFDVMQKKTITMDVTLVENVLSINRNVGCSLAEEKWMITLMTIKDIQDNEKYYVEKLGQKHYTKILNALIIQVDLLSELLMEGKKIQN